jgi:23S rRNA (adenine2503-C2)-methyltransferase
MQKDAYNTFMEKGIESYSIEGIEGLLADYGQPRFRSKQLVQWIYGRGVDSYEHMTDVPAALREKLNREAPLFIPNVDDKQVSQDGARKYLLKLSDGAKIETVGIPSHEKGQNGRPKRLTVCFSTQVGCPMACSFCATGREGFERNLLPGEMAQQVLAVQRDMGIKATNAVAMGQGEPFLNYKNLIDALRIINDSRAIDIGARHITVSTCGIIDMIETFGKEPYQYTLAVSLHSALQKKRNQLMPHSKTAPLENLKKAIGNYYSEAGRRTSLEYMLIDSFNDGVEDLDALIRFCKGLHVHVNILPVNNVAGSSLVPSKKSIMQKWCSELGKHGIENSIRDSRGSDIAGACGQLKNESSRQGF